MTAVEKFISEMTQQPSRRLSEQQKLEILNRDIIARLNEKLNKGHKEPFDQEFEFERKNLFRGQTEKRRFSLQLQQPPFSPSRQPYSPSRQRMQLNSAGRERKSSCGQSTFGPRQEARRTTSEHTASAHSSQSQQESSSGETNKQQL